MAENTENYEATGTISTQRHQRVRFRIGHDCGDVFGLDSNFDGISLTLEVADHADAQAMLEAIAAPTTTVMMGHVPGTWRCPKCNFRLLQSNLNASDGTVTPRDTPGDKCPNCEGPLWRVSWEDEAKENLAIAESQMDRALKAEKSADQTRSALRLAIEHIEHMAAHFSNCGTGYSFEALGEDMPGIKAALAAKEGS